MKRVAARRRSLTRALLLSVIVLQGGMPARGEGDERTPPYDFGDPTGTLVGASVPCVTITYSIPPFPSLRCQLVAGSWTGIYVDVGERSRITLSASIRNIGPVDPPMGMWACFGVRPPDSPITFGAIGCTPVPSSGERQVMTTVFEETVWGDGFEPGRYAFLIDLKDRDDAPLHVRGLNVVSVESISFQELSLV